MRYRERAIGQPVVIGIETRNSSGLKTSDNAVASELFSIVPRPETPFPPLRTDYVHFD